MRLYSARAMSSVIGVASIVGAFWTPALALQQPHPTLANGTLAVPMPGTDSVTVAAGARYRAGDFRRWFSGDLYRDLWTTPIRVPVLDLEKYAGGLQPTKTGGGMQTKSLQFEAADGREFVFRTVDKSGTTAPIEVRKSPVNGLIQDQVSAMHPAAAEIAAPIVEAAGVLHPVATIVMMPDDSDAGRIPQGIRRQARHDRRVAESRPRRARVSAAPRRSSTALSC